MESEQSLVARLLHSLWAQDRDMHFAILEAARTHLLKGGPRRLRHTLPALGFATLQLVRRVAGVKGALESPATEPEAAANTSADAPAEDGAAEKAAAAAEDGEVSGADKATDSAPAAAAPAAEAESVPDTPCKVTAEQLLQWLLAICVMLAELPEPVMALRLMLAGAYSASEEARLEMLAYEFFEQVSGIWHRK